MSSQIYCLRSLVASSPLRTRFADFARKVNISKASKSDRQAKQKSGHLEAKTKAFVEVIEAKPENEKYERPDKEKAEDSQIAKEYTRQLQKREQAHHKLVNYRIKLRDTAVKALPLELQEEARKRDDELLPLDRHVFTDFPPDPGFLDNFGEQSGHFNRN
mmetsp:Transcript_26147/g.40925  ORF Transcript_26147/g.40925 Transcript_26147/m.40925 type:complete len:160 (-) Transcript_26147:490-969(-)